MKAVILAGGYGTRLAEETEVKPKPMVEIGGQPILWHILKLFARHGITEFVIALGYKGDVIKRHFLDYQALSGSMTIDLATGALVTHSRSCESWKVHLIDTGLGTLTGGRLGRLRDLLKDETFLVTYGDGVSDVDIGALIAFHKEQGRLGTVTAVRPPARFGGIVFEGPRVGHFTEKPQTGEGWINGGFMVFEPKVLDLIHADNTSLEAEVLEGLAAKEQLSGFRHEGFWQCMDTLRDKRYLEQLWTDGNAPWKVWE